MSIVENVGQAAPPGWLKGAVYALSAAGWSAAPVSAVR